MKILTILFVLLNIISCKGQTKEIKFTDLFNEGSTIKFTPNVLEKDRVFQVNFMLTEKV